MKNLPILRLLAIVLLHQFYGQADGTCYFPPEFQGEYKMQSANSEGRVQYSTLNITANAIPIWGNCHQRIGNNFILMINYAGNSCIRCLHLKLRSKNILQVHGSSQQTISKCYINEESAAANCPPEEALQNRSSAEIILFKTKDMEGNEIAKEYCPIDGRYSVKYLGNEKQGTQECIGFESQLDSCPSGSTMNIHFRHCKFPDSDLKLDCLGHWEGPSGQMYLALLDNSKLSTDQKPQYRCAIYKRDPGTGIISMAIGRDSTCTTELHNATHGYESFVLMPKDENSWPPEVLYSQCSFPDWMIGNWEDVRVEDNTFTYKDHSSFKTYTIKCVGILDSNDKYLVFGRTQCDEEQYNCMRAQKRSNNIMEFQLGKKYSRNKDVFALCADTNFEDAWITQGRLDRKMEASCPISGEYTGEIPDTTELCAKLWSDCQAPQLMYYQVLDCVTSEIYEEREYRCLGHWRESELLYTYTQRHDVAAETFECFVGSIISEKEDIYIKEAGEDCEREYNPLRSGMKLIKQGLYSCIGQIPSTRYEVTTKKLSTPTPTNISTKPWNIGVPYPTIPDGDNNNINNTVTRVSVHLFALVAPVIVIFYL